MPTPHAVSQLKADAAAELGRAVPIGEASPSTD